MSYQRRGIRSLRGGMGDAPNISCPAGQSPVSTPSSIPFAPEVWACANNATSGGGGNTGSSSGGGVLDTIASIFGGKPYQQPVYMAPSSGPSTGTVLLIGGAALIGLFLVMRK